MATKDWHEDIRRNVKAAADEIAARGADAIITAAPFCTGAEIVVHFDNRTLLPTVEYRIKTLPEGCWYD